VRNDFTEILREQEKVLTAAEAEMAESWKVEPVRGSLGRSPCSGSGKISTPETGPSPCGGTRRRRGF
jgi:hypothetical protein